MRKKKFALNRKKKGRHREKRRKEALTDNKRLYEDAPVGAYRIDEIAQGIFRSGAALEASMAKFISITRDKIGFAAGYALIVASNDVIARPRARRLAKRFFEDLQVIRSRIERNRNLTNFDLTLSTHIQFRIPGSKGREEEVGHLFTALQNASDQIEKFLTRYQLDRRGGNRDELTRAFIDELFEYWCDHYTGNNSQNEARLFTRFLVAAWQDVGFPADHRAGRNLETWLADRVRKQFSKGVATARIQRQEHSADERPPDPKLSDELPPDPDL